MQWQDSFDRGAEDVGMLRMPDVRWMAGERYLCVRGLGSSLRAIVEFRIRGAVWSCESPLFFILRSCPPPEDTQLPSARPPHPNAQPPLISQAS